MSNQVNKIKIILPIIIIGLFFSLSAFANPNYSDASFNAPTLESPGSLTAVAVQSDGKILIGSRFYKVNGTPTDSLARLNADGSLDAGFNSVDRFLTGSTINSIAVQTDGKILVGGFMTTSNGTRFISRVNSNGTLDSAFDAAISVNSNVNEIAVQPDGKIIIAGAFFLVNGNNRMRIARLNSDGTLDSSFTVGTGFNSTVTSLTLQTDGKILVGGSFSNFNGTTMSRLARLNADGSLDTSFTIGTGANSNVEAIGVQSDGKILIGGFFTTYNGTSRDRLARLNADGTLDGGFLPAALGSIVSDIAIQTDGKIIIGGFFSLQVRRLNTDGSNDAGFNVGTGGSGGVVNKTLLLSDGKIFAVGTFTAFNGTARSGIVKLNANGSTDISLTTALLTRASVNTIVQQNDGKILIGGDFTLVNGIAQNRIARLNSDGTLDVSFNTGTGVDGVVNSIAVQTDGKILLVGSFSTINGSSRSFIARLNSDGSLDTSFNPALRSTPATKVILQPDGKILIGGILSIQSGVFKDTVTRLNADGSLDNSLTANINSNINDLVLQADGKIVVGGTFTTVDTISRNRIARLNSNGTLDTTFNPGTGANSTVETLALTPDGDILAGGFFTIYNGANNRGGIVRLDANGNIDSGWNPSSGTNNRVRTILVLSSGKILIGGSFTTVNGQSFASLARIFSNGNTDLTFQNQSINQIINALVLQSDGKFLLGGSFSSLGGANRTGIARLCNYGFSLNAKFIEFGQTATGTIELNLPAPFGGTTINLSSSNSSAASVPATITIAEGQTIGTFEVSTPAIIFDENVNISASFQSNTQTAPLRVIDEKQFLNLKFEDNSIGVGGEIPTTTSGLIFETGINGKGAYFSDAQLFYPALNNIDAQEGTIEFWIKPRWAGNDNLQHTILRWGLGGGMIVTKDGANNLRLYLNRFIAEKGIAINISGWQPNEWHHVVFSWSNSEKRLRGFIDGTEIPPVTFTGELPLISDTEFQIGNHSAFANLGNDNVDAVIDELRINRVAFQPLFESLTNLSLNVPQIGGGGTVQGTVTLSAPAPSGGAVVYLTSDNPAATVPASVTVPKGQTSANYSISTSAVMTNTNVNLTATYLGIAQNAPLLVLQPSAAEVSIGGQVLTADGRGISRATVILTDSNGTIRTARTNAFGYFNFDEVSAGGVYVINVRHRIYNFSPQVITVKEDISDLNFTAIE